MMNLPEAQERVVRSALQYWEERWDWEAPLLFGLSRDEYSNVAASWPGHSENHALAAIGALRELLDGASALRSDEAVRAAIGVGQAEAAYLLAKLLEDHNEPGPN